MYVLTKDVSHTHRALAMLVVVALMFWTIGYSGFTGSARAANVTFFSDTLSDSAPTVVSDHTIEFTLETAMAADDTFVITFPAGFDTSSIVLGDVDLASSTVDQTLAGANGVDTWGVTGLGTDVITFEAPSNVGVAAGVTIEVQIGLNAAGGANQIVNPGTGSYDIELTGTMADTGTTMVAIVDNVLVTANIDTTFTFTIDGVSNGSPVNGSPTTTATTTTSTTLPFETLVAGTSKTLAQRLGVLTNAANGFVVTVEQDGNLLSSTGGDIDGFIDGAYTDSPASWVAPSGDVLDDTTWGHWGLTTTDTDLEGAGEDFLSNEWIAASNTPRAIFAHDGPADDVTSGIGSTTVGYQAQITGLQEAGDYSTTLTYIATPSF